MAWDTAPALTFTSPNTITATFEAGDPPSGWGTVPWSRRFIAKDEDFNYTEKTITASTTSVVFNGLTQGKSYEFYKQFYDKWGTSVQSFYSSYTIPFPNHTAILSSNDRFANGSDQIVFTINKNGSSLNTRIRLNGPGAVDTVIVASSSGTSLNWTVPTSLNASITTKEFETYTINVDTMDGATMVGTNNYTITVRVPNAAPYLPTATRTLSEQVSAVNTITANAYYVATKSVLRILAGGNAGQNATVTKREILYKLSGVQQTANVTASPYYIELSGATLINITDIQVRTTDSRGRVSLLTTLTPSIYPYSEPTITTFDVKRCDAGGTISSSGQYFKTSAVVGAQSIIHTSTQRNTLQYTITASPNVANPIRSYGPSATVTDSWLNNVSGANGYDKNQSYIVTLTVTDRFGSTKSSSITIPTELVPLSIGTFGIGVGKIFDTSAGQALDVVGNTRLTGNLNVTGTVTMTVPSHNHTGEQITSGTIPEARIPVLTAAKIPVLDASKVTTGTFSADRIPNLSAAKITSGNLPNTVNRLGALIPASQDLNTYVTEGWYQQNVSANAANGTNYPVANAGLLEVFPQYDGTDTNMIWQRYTSYQHTSPVGGEFFGPTIYIRARYNGNWSVWNEVFGSSGVQTSGLITDTHGVCTRFPDGTQICYNRRSITPTANSVTSFTWTFPLAFSSDPAVTVTANTGASNVTNTCVDGSPSTTSCKPGILRTNNTSTELLAVAMGRWK